MTYTGSELAYTVRVRNNGTIPTPSTEVSVFDLPFTFTSATLTPSKGTVVTGNFVAQVSSVVGNWYVGTLAPSEEATCQVRVSAAPFGIENQVWTVRPYVQSLKTNDPVASNDETSLTLNRVSNANLPDLTLTNLTIPTPSVQQGQILNFKADFKNIGTAAATGNFTVKSYLSTDNVLSANDYADGSVPTGNYAAGFTVAQVLAAMTVRNTLAAGQYYLILKIDADNQVTESNENNNVIVSAGLITVTGSTGGGGYERL